MGCVFGREVSSGVVSESKEVTSTNLSAQSSRNLDNVSVTKTDTNIETSQNEESQKEDNEVVAVESKKPRGERRRKSSRPNPRLSNPPKHIHGEQVAAGWPPWLSAVCGEALNGWIPRRADTFEKIDKIGSGTYSNVYKARDLLTGKVVALKKVRFDNLEPESVKFMAREILILRRLDHTNVVKLEGLVTSRMSCSLYLVFEYMEHDLAGLAASPDVTFTETQVKCYIQQLLSGLEHCHKRGIADFGLASFFDPNRRHPMTSRVVTLWYRPPELLLGATEYGVGVDLWSAGCILAELLAGKPIMPGRTEVEQLHKIYKLCGSPSDEYWKKSKLPNATLFKPREPYKRSIRETFKDFPRSSLPLIETLLAMDPAERQTATAALNSEFFTTEPYACEPSSLPKYPPSKEIDAKRRDDEARRQRAAAKAQNESTRKPRIRDRTARGMPAPEANAELQSNIDRRRLVTHANAKSKSEKFPPPHQDGAVGYPLGASHHIDPSVVPSDVPFSTNSFTYSKEPVQTWSGPLGGESTGGHRRKKHGDGRESSKVGSSHRKRH
ncbi:Probable serine/threonine-protein kinase At1g54610 [Linum perenne]